MSCSCCSTDTPTQSVACPACGQQGDAVTTTTLLHQLRRPWQQEVGDADYYFCSRRDCDVVYFSAQGAAFNTGQLRQAVGQKSTAAERTLCYCFDIRFNDIEERGAEQRLRDFVIAKTRDKLCRCEERNPSGRCCLRDFPKPLE